MPGERDLTKLLAKLEPTLHPDSFVFCSFRDFQLPRGLAPICQFREREGLTAIVEEGQALRLGLAHEFPARLISLRVHSDLNAVGLLSAVLHVMAAAGIPCNVVSGFFHDHLFVPRQQAALALDELQRFAPDA